jgi:transcriptional regulator with XRE-family HTH domain
MMPRYKVTPEKVKEVKKLKGLSQRQIARRVQVSQTVVWQIKHGRYDSENNLKKAPKKEGFFEDYRPVTI